jgi:hypothetical protein
MKLYLLKSFLYKRESLESVNPFLLKLLQFFANDLLDFVHGDEFHTPMVGGTGPFQTRATRKILPYYDMSFSPRSSGRRIGRTEEGYHRRPNGSGDMHRPSVVCHEQMTTLQKSGQLKKTRLSSQINPSILLDGLFNNRFLFLLAEEE